MTFNGVCMVCWGNAVDCVVELVVFLRNCVLLVGGAVSVEYDAGASSRMFLFVM